MKGRKMNMATMNLFMDGKGSLQRHRQLNAIKPVSDDTLTSSQKVICSCVHYYLAKAKLEDIKNTVPKRLPLDLMLKKCLLQYQLNFKINTKWLKNTGYTFETIFEMLSCGKPVLISFASDKDKAFKNAKMIITDALDFGDYQFIAGYDGTSNVKYYLNFDNISTISSIVY